nr:outer membrane beta-barrel protein [Bacteroidota bacterium]
MNKLSTAFLIIIIFLFASVVSAQSIKGKVIDATNSEPLVGATIKIVGTNTGAISDVDGTYSVEGIDAGIYDVKVTYIGYTSKLFKSINVSKGGVVKLNVVMEVDGLTTDVIIVEATLTMANEQALLIEQKNSDNVQDGISEQQIKRAPDAAASDVLKRITGISIVNDKYVFVRGTSERYNNTTLNGVLLPSTDPDKKSFSFDLFPSNLLENVIVSKTFTPDQSANYSGGLVQINTKDFPDDLTMNYSLSGGYNTLTSTKSFSTYDASNKSFLFFNLGLDDSRMLPSNIPSTQIKNNNFNREQLRDFSRSFKNNWAQSDIKAPLNTGLVLSIGNSYKLGNIPIGFLAAYSYKSSYSNKEVNRDEYNTDHSKIISYAGTNSQNSILWGGLLNLSAKLNEYNKISLKATYTLSSDDETEYYNGYVNGLSGSDYLDRQLYITRFVQRNLLSTQLFGEHVIANLNHVKLDWNASYSSSIRNEPDMKTMTYQREFGTQDPFYAAINPNFGNTYAGGRFFSELSDINRSFALNVEIPFKFNLPFITDETSNSKFKIGGFGNGTRRNFDARNFGVAYFIGMPFNILYEPVNEIFKPENFDVNKLFYDELTNETDTYNASENIYALYSMFDIPVSMFRFILGARYEYSEQSVNTLGIIGNPVSNYLKNIDVLPSLNVVYKLNEMSNIRAAYSQTISRPELREIAPFSYVDFVTSTQVFGNSIDLHRTLVRNYDLRYEVFPNPGEIISVSLFYKYIDAPIEEVFVPTSTNRIKSFANAENGARNYGIEFEFRKNLGFISNFLKYLSLNSNLTLVSSKVDLEGIGTVATKKDRRMQGQSPFMINVGLFYDNYDIGTSVNIVYNRFGDRISEVGLSGYEDTREKGKDLLDLTITKKIFANFEVKFSINDILNQDHIYLQEINGK